MDEKPARRDFVGGTQVKVGVSPVDAPARDRQCGAELRWERHQSAMLKHIGWYFMGLFVLKANN